jgi:two-component system, LuxR family, sensor kinase FixL
VPGPGVSHDRRCAFLVSGGLALLLATAMPSLQAAQAADGARDLRGRSRNVLVLHAYPRLSPPVVSIDEAFRSTLETQSPFPIYFYTEYLDLSLFDGDTPQRELHALLRRKYASQDIDLILAGGSRALRVALQNRVDLFSGAPLVFVGVDRMGVADLRLDVDVTGTWLRQDWTGTLDLARRLQPDTRGAVVVAGGSPADQTWVVAARRQLDANPEGLEIRYLTDRSLAQILEQVGALPPQTVVLVGAFQRDATGQNFTTRDAIARIAAASRVPVYVLQDHSVGIGSVGGQVVSFESHGRMAAELALRVLRGERPAPTDAGTTVPMLDWRQLQRWALDEQRLPPGSVVLFREPSMWERYRGWILGAVALLLLQSALIVALLVHRARHRAARRALAERLRFETLLSDLAATLAASPVSDVDRQLEIALRRIVDDLGADRATIAALSPSSDQVRVTHSWTREGVAPLREMIRGNDAPWIVSRLRQGHVVRLGPGGDVPGEAAVDQQTLARFGTRSGLVVPLVVGGSVGASLAVGTVREKRRWPDELVPRLQLLGVVFANALARQQSERAVRESEERFHHMADSAPVMVWIAGPDGRRTYVNQRWLDFTGRRLDDELSESWVADVHPNDQPDLTKTLSAAVTAGRAFTIEYRLRRRDGEYRWVLNHGVPRRADGGVLVGYVGSTVDVTQLRVAQRAMLETDLLRSAIFGALHGHVAALDKSGRIIAVNHAWGRFALENGGNPVRVSIGASYLDVCRKAAAAGDRDAGRILEALKAVLAGGTPVEIEYACHTPGGERWFEMTVEPLRRHEGGALVTHVDVTRRHQAEEEAQRQREELAHVLRTATLGELAASLAHEINQPLAAIVANAQATRRGLGGSPVARPDIVEALSDIVDDAKRASQVIRRLRALFRKEPVLRRPVDVNELVDDVVGLLRHDTERHRITVHRAVGQGLARIPGDAIQLQQVFLNLLVNAREAIAITETGPRVIAIGTTTCAGGGVAVSIRDSGIGAKDADLERIFDHFVTTKPDGLGMGLAISRSIVQAHGGRIWATVNDDRGLTLHVELPEAPGPGGA